MSNDEATVQLKEQKDVVVHQAPLATIDAEDDGEELGEDGINADVRCGYWKWRPNCLQTFNTPFWLVFCISMYSMCLGFIVNGINNVNNSSIERRFDLQSTHVGFISSSYDITAALLAVVFGYWGSGKNKARLLGFAVFVSAVGSMIMAIPHFSSDEYTLGASTNRLCSSVKSLNETCSSYKGGSSLQKYAYIFMLGQLLHGIGGTTLLTVGVSLIDDSVMPNQTPLCLGIVYGCNIVGSGLGYIIGGQFLQFYVDFDTKPDVDLTPTDPRWVGAWWLGPVGACVAQIITSIPLSLFGSELPSAKEIRKHRTNQAHVTSSSQLSRKFGELKFVQSVVSLTKNPCFMFVTLTMVMEAMCMTGLAAFLPKFVENQYGVSASFAATMSGLAVIPAAAGGLVLGGWIAKRWNFNIKQCMKMIIILSTISGLGGSIIWVRCQRPIIYGVNKPYAEITTLHLPVSLESPCNSLCHCDTDMFKPVCSNRTEMFFSACFAGCTVSKSGELSNCACTTDIEGNATIPLTSNNCESYCSALYVFISFLFVNMCLSFMPIAPSDSIQLRCVHEDLKTFAQGVKSFIVRVFGSFMGPIIVGKLLDLNCNVWREKCGQTLSCWLYDHEMLVTSIFIYILVCKSISVMFCCLALKFYHPPPTETKETEDDESSSPEPKDAFVPKHVVRPKQDSPDDETRV